MQTCIFLYVIIFDIYFLICNFWYTYQFRSNFMWQFLSEFFRGYGLRNATAYILIYDITNEESFEYIKTIRDQIMESREIQDVPIYVVGNKHDLSDNRCMPRREVANLIKKQWKCDYIECSAKYNWHVVLLFKELMKDIDSMDLSNKPNSIRMPGALRRNNVSFCDTNY